MPERAALATGTGTDAVVLASSLAGDHKLQYSGTHTEMERYDSGGSSAVALKEGSVASLVGTRPVRE